MIYGMKLQIFYKMRNQRIPQIDQLFHTQVPDGILYILGTGCQWKLLPKDYGSGSRCHRSFQEWMQLGIFDKFGLDY